MGIFKIAVFLFRIQYVTENPRYLPVGAKWSLSTRSTLAIDGPRCSQAYRESRAPAVPSAQTSTLPSALFRT